MFLSNNGVPNSRGMLRFGICSSMDEQTLNWLGSRLLRSRPDSWLPFSWLRRRSLRRGLKSRGKCRDTCWGNRCRNWSRGSCWHEGYWRLRWCIRYCNFLRRGWYWGWCRGNCWHSTWRLRWRSSCWNFAMSWAGRWAKSLWSSNSKGWRIDG